MSHMDGCGKLSSGFFPCLVTRDKVGKVDRGKVELVVEFRLFPESVGGAAEGNRVNARLSFTSISYLRHHWVGPEFLLDIVHRYAEHLVNDLDDAIAGPDVLLHYLGHGAATVHEHVALQAALGIILLENKNRVQDNIFLTLNSK